MILYFYMTYLRFIIGERFIESNFSLEPLPAFSLLKNVDTCRHLAPWFRIGKMFNGFLKMCERRNRSLFYEIFRLASASLLLLTQFFCWSFPPLSFSLSFFLSLFLSLTHTHARTHTHTHIYTYIYIYRHTNTNTHTQKNTHARTHTHTHTHTHYNLINEL